MNASGLHAATHVRRSGSADLKSYRRSDVSPNSTTHAKDRGKLLMQRMRDPRKVPEQDRKLQWKGCHDVGTGWDRTIDRNFKFEDQSGDSGADGGAKAILGHDAVGTRVVLTPFESSTEDKKPADVAASVSRAIFSLANGTNTCADAPNQPQDTRIDLIVYAQPGYLVAATSFLPRQSTASEDATQVAGLGKPGTPRLTHW